MATAMTAREVIEQIKKGKSADNLVITDLETTKIPFRDAVLLTEHGFHIPAGNIAYNDEDIASDSDFDEVEWTGKFRGLSDVLEEEGVYASESESITIELSLEDEQVKAWLLENGSKLKDLMSKLVVDLYYTEQILHSK